MSLSIAAASSLGIFLLVASCFAEKAPYASFSKDATLTPEIVYYDYIIIGGGTAGCALAATLSAAANVLILERGGLPYDTPSITRLGTVINLLDVSVTFTSQLFLTTDGVYSHRGRVLGGSSAINLGFYTRARDQEVRENGWDLQLVIESYQWVESKLVVKSDVGEWQDAVKGGLLEVGVVPDRGFTYEHLNETKVGGSIFDENGYRHSAADLLEYANSTNIDVYLHAIVHQILFQTTEGRTKAHGVSFMDSNGNLHKAYLNKNPGNEIILSAGAIGSPQLLMLSGIGPTQELEAQGINVILDQPMVGQGMSDNPLNLIIVPSPNPVELSLAGVVGISDSGNYFEAASGLIDNQSIPFLRQIIVQATRGLGLNLNPSIPVGVIGQKFPATYSTGSLKLKTTNPNDSPRVTFNYYQDHRDRLQCVKGIETIKNVIESRSFTEFKYPLTSFQTLKTITLLTPINLRRKNLASVYSTEQFCVDTVISFWHYHGGCQMNKVVDRDYKVIGVDSLRVIDGSTFLNSPGTNPQATVMMLGRYMGQRILQEQGIH